MFLFRWNGKLKEMGLVGAASVSLSDARTRAAKCRSACAAGLNPIDVRSQERNANAPARSFRDVAVDYHAAKSHDWRNEKLKKQWMSPLERYASQIMVMPMNAVRTKHVLSVLQPIYMTKCETAS